MPEWTDLVGTLGPVGGVLFWIWLNDRKVKAESPKDDPAAKLVAEMAALRSAINDMRSDFAELTGFIKGRMK